MRCRSLAFAAVITFTGVSHAEDLQIATVAIVAEPVLVGPIADFRSIRSDGRTWRLGISGWNTAISLDRPPVRGRTLFATLSITPYNAHSTARMYRDGERDRSLDFDSASYGLRAGIRGPNRRGFVTEATIAVAHEALGDDAPEPLRTRWNDPYAGVQVIERYRRIKAEDPLSAAIEGVDAALSGEMNSGDQLWTRAILSGTAGGSLHGFHLQQSLSFLTGSKLDTVSAFLVGGSWDILGPTALYGSRYAQFRIRRGVVANSRADYSLTPHWKAGLRFSAMRGDSQRATGGALQVTRHIGGVRITAGAGHATGNTNVFAAVSGSLFRK